MCKSVAFTGHRNIPRDKEQGVRQQVKDAVLHLHNQGCRTFLCGMAVGFDMLAAEVVLSLKETLPDIRLVAVVPYKGQSERWSSYEQRRYERLLTMADKVRVLSERYYDGCLLRRNDYMISHANHIIAYFDGKPKGGTFYTVRKTTAKGLTVTNLFNNSV